jgi:F0F1-type ATP synthase membrane subunit b/b'
MQARARSDAERILEQARTECENLKRQALTDLRVYAVNCAMAEAETTIRETMTSGERKKLFTDFTEKLGVRS